METMIDALYDVVLTESETEAQPDPAQPGDHAVETELTQEISALWSDRVRLSANHNTTAKGLRLLRARLAERLHAMKCMLSRPGRGGQWRSWLKERGIPRSSADRLCDRHAETLGIENGNAPHEAFSEPAAMTVEKLVRVVWSRFGKFLATDESVIEFICRFTEISGVGHEQRAEGLVIFKLVPEVTDESPGSAIASVPVSQFSGQTPAITDVPKEETAAAPTEVGLVVAAEETSNGSAA